MRFNKKFLIIILILAATFSVAKADSENTITITDILNETTIGIKGTNINYRELEDVSVGSAALYNINCGHSQNRIELRSDNEPYGIVMTASNGNVSKLTIEWYEKTQNLRSVSVYGSNEPYSSPKDLYDEDKRGDLLGTLKRSEAINDISSLVITGEYAYLGIRSDVSQLFINELSISWEVVAPDEKFQLLPPHFLTDGGFVQKGTKVEIISPVDDAEIHYTLDGRIPTLSSPIYTGPIEINHDATIIAVTLKDGISSEPASETFIAAEAVTNINSIAALAEGDAVIINRPLTVVYSQGDCNYIFDGNYYGFIRYPSLSAGYVIGASWKGRVTKDEEGLTELTPIDNLSVTDKVKVALEPKKVQFDDYYEIVKASNAHAYVTIINVEFKSGSEPAQKKDADSHPVNIDDRYASINGLSGTYDVTGFIGLENGEPVIYAISFTMSDSGTIPISKNSVKAVYYDPQGRRVLHPEQGKIYIIVQDGNVRKHIP